MYEHWRPDKGLPFYVGKGSGNRAFTIEDRPNRRHGFIYKYLLANGLSPEVRIVFNSLDEEAAFYLEKSTISYWRARGIELTNNTDGGEGVSMRTIPAEEKAIITANISASNKIKWNDTSRSKSSETVKKKWEDPLFREKMINSVKDRYKNPEYRTKMQIITTKSLHKSRKKRMETFQSEEHKLLVSTNSKRAWQDPNSRKKLLAGLEKARAARQTKRKLKLLETK